MSQADWQCPNQRHQWSRWLAAGLHARNRWRLPVLLAGSSLPPASAPSPVGSVPPESAPTTRTTITSSPPWDARPDRRLGNLIAAVVDLAVARSAVGGHRRLPHQPLRPQGRRGPHPPPSHARPDQPEVLLHIWVTPWLALRHPLWGAIALPLRAMLYVRQKTMPTIPTRRGWQFRTKPQLAVRLLQWLAPLVKNAG